MSFEQRLHDLPGGERIAAGLTDHAAGLGGINACLVRIARPRLSRDGYIAPPDVSDASAELDLYEILMNEPGNPYGRYNALIRELVSFEHALDHLKRKPDHS